MDSQPNDSQSISKVELSRRGAICALATFTLGTFAAPAVAANGVRVLSNGKVEVTLARNPALKSVGGVVRIDNVNGRSIALVRTARGRQGFTAIDLRCTHEGGRLVQNSDQWRCREHGAVFALDGEFQNGPDGTTTLRRLRVTATSRKVTIS